MTELEALALANLVDAYNALQNDYDKNKSLSAMGARTDVQRAIFKINQIVGGQVMNALRANSNFILTPEISEAAKDVAVTHTGAVKKSPVWLPGTRGEGDTLKKKGRHIPSQDVQPAGKQSKPERRVSTTPRHELLKAAAEPVPADSRIEERTTEQLPEDLANMVEEQEQNRETIISIAADVSQVDDKSVTESPSTKSEADTSMVSGSNDDEGKDHDPDRELLIKFTEESVTNLARLYGLDQLKVIAEKWGVDASRVTTAKGMAGKLKAHAKKTIEAEQQS
jgi:hypothetical protein